MKPLIFFIFTGIFSPAICFPALSLEPITIREDTKYYTLGKHSEIFKDKSGDLRIEDILFSLIPKKARLGTVNYPNFGLSDSAYWLHFSVSNATMNNEGLLLEISWPLFDSIQIYKRNDNGNYILKSITGTSYPFSSRPLEHRNFLFEMDLSPGETGDYYVRVQSSNTGIGIPCDKLETIFKPFEQADGSSSRMHNGTGLGLSITKKLVELHGGSIRVESGPGAGAAFIFTLPVSAERREEDQTMPSSAVSITGMNEKMALATDKSLYHDIPATKTKRILAVDDDPVNLQVIHDQLSAFGYTVDRAPDGIQALVKLEKNPYDLVLLDVMMPRLSGYDVCKRIREKYSPHELPVIMLSAKDQVADLIGGFDAGANDYLTKPVTRGELSIRIRTYLENASFHKNLVRLNDELDGLMKEFSRITARIHNSLKNKLESVRNYLACCIDFHEDESVLKENLEIATKLVSHCSVESKNILFVINNQKCSLRKILDELELQATLCFTDEEISYTIRKENLSEEKVIKPAVVQYLLKVYTELLNNIVKHAAATEVSIVLYQSDDCLGLKVRDNGVGFDYERQKHTRNSYGLAILESLTAEMAGSLSIDSRMGQGTAVQISVRE